MCPITLDLKGNGLKLTGPHPAIYFDLDGDGELDHSSWTRRQTKDAFLVLDRNDNGTIDDGREMFGNATPLLLAPEIAAHGYVALAEFDDPRLGGDGDGVISAGDRIYEHLRLWFDTNRDAFTQPSELATLTEAQVAAISLDIAYDGGLDQWGNEFRWTSEIAFESGDTSTAVDIYFKRQDSPE